MDSSSQSIVASLSVAPPCWFPPLLHHQFLHLLLSCRGHCQQMLTKPCQPEQHSSIVAFLYCCCCYCFPLLHSPSHLSQIKEHQLSLLANADEAIFPKPRCFWVCWWLKFLSYSTCICCRWYFFSGKSLFSSLETAWPIHSKYHVVFAIHGCPLSCCWLPNFELCLAHSWASSSFPIQFSYYTTSWLLSRSLTRWWVSNSIYTKS